MADHHFSNTVLAIQKNPSTTRHTVTYLIPYKCDHTIPFVHQMEHSSTNSFHFMSCLGGFAAEQNRKIEALLVDVQAT
jgi:hypothetical protein